MPRAKEREACPECGAGDAVIYTKTAGYAAPGVRRIYDCQKCGRLYRHGEGVKS